MKKKIISLSLVMVMLMGLSACGNKTTTGTSSKAAETSAAKSAEESSSSDSSAEPSAASDDELKDYNRVSVVEYEKMYINYHKQRYQNNFSHGFYYEDKTGKKRNCIPLFVTYDEEVFGKPFEGELKDIFDVYNNGDIFMAASRAPGSGVPYNMGNDVVLIETDSSEKVNINGIDTIRFTGHASYYKTNDGLKNFYVTGYTFIFNGKPYMLVGVIFGVKDGDDLRDSMDKEIECMMKTVRSEKKKEGITID